MKALVTGAAGFIGSHLSEALLTSGWTVLGVDSFSSYYDPSRKRDNLASALQHPRFHMVESDLSTDPLTPLLTGIDVAFHLAGQPGVSTSWGRDFSSYVQANILATQCLLEAARETGLDRLIYASSSSVYGRASDLPISEAHPTRPVSPYGVSKLAGEHLVTAYTENFSLSSVILRYHTVYGPRQRPDMAIHRLIEASMNCTPFPMYGAGEFVRDFTEVSDVVGATIAAASQSVPSGTVLNVAGGSAAQMVEVLRLVEDLTGRAIPIQRLQVRPGDVAATGGSIEEARRIMGWFPQMTLADGLRRQIEWHRARQR